MASIFRCLTLASVAALFAVEGSAPAGAATNQAVLTVTAIILNSCDVYTQPSTLAMSYNPLQNLATLGTSSFTYACTSGGYAAGVTPTSTNVVTAPNWETKNGANNLLYTLWNSTTCTTGQLKNGTLEILGPSNGLTQTYNICAIPNLGQQTSPAGTYTDTVTFTSNFGP